MPTSKTAPALADEADGGSYEWRAALRTRGLCYAVRVPWSAKPPLRRLVATARAHWWVEQDYRELKEELGLDHFEGCSWQGFHHHLALGHGGVRLPASGTSPPASSRTRKACPCPRCRQCAACFKPRASA